MSKQHTTFKKNIKTSRNDGVLFDVLLGSCLAHFGSFSVTFCIILVVCWHQFHENGTKIIKNRSLWGARDHLCSQGCEDEEKRAKSWFAGHPGRPLLESFFGHLWGLVCRFRVYFSNVFLEGFRTLFWKDLGSMLGVILNVFLECCVLFGHDEIIVLVWQAV